MKIADSNCYVKASMPTMTTLLIVTMLQFLGSDGLTTKLHAPTTQRHHQRTIVPLFPSQPVVSRIRTNHCRSGHCYRNFLRYKNDEDLDSSGNTVFTRYPENEFDGSIVEDLDSAENVILWTPEEDDKSFEGLEIVPNPASPLLSTSSVLGDDNTPEILVNIHDPSDASKLTTTSEHVEINASPATSEHIEVNASSSSEKSSSTSTKATVKEILALGLPSLGSCLVDPVMSLVDTACVGQVSTIQLASLAPCTSICQFLFFSFFFLSAATTTFVAANPHFKDAVKAEDADFKAEQIVSSASALSIVLGVMVASILLAFTDKLLLLAGCSSTEMLISARKYLRMRAIGLPAVFFTMVVQGASLGRQDAYTPLKVFSLAGIVNLVGDAVLTLGLGWGVTGAAIATTASQCLAGAYFAYRTLRHRRQRLSSQLSLKTDEVNGEESVTQKEESSSVSPVALVWRGLPDKKVGLSFAAMALTLMLKQIVNMTSYSAMTRKAATMGPLALAAHLVTLQVFWMLSFIPEPIGMALQSLIARDKNGSQKSSDQQALQVEEGKREDAKTDSSVYRRVRKLIRTGFLMSSATGVFIALITGFCLTCPAVARNLVQDASVRSIIAGVAPFAMLAQVICPISCVADAACLGLNDIRHLPSSTLVSTLALIFGLRSVQNFGSVAAVGNMIRGGATASKGIMGRLVGGGGVKSTWMCLVIYYGVRTLGNTLLSRKLKGFLFSNGDK